MPSSQFKIFTNTDLNAPQLNGFSGSLIPVLNYCLTTGSGWLQPSASVSNARGDIVQAIYQQPSGSGCILYINDAWPTTTADGKEASATGWENLTSMTVPNGTGSGQFPMYGQCLTTGRFTFRKSSTATSAPRPWIMFVDNYTFYFFCRDYYPSNFDLYNAMFFGDMFSLRGAADKPRCILTGRVLDNNSAGEKTDMLVLWPFPYTYSTFNNTYALNIATPRNMGGRYTSPGLGMMGDTKFTSNAFASVNIAPISGIMSSPNPSDGVLYMHPIFLWEPNQGLRGRMRGMYHIPCPAAYFPDGTVLKATGEFSGKTIQIVGVGINGGFWAIEVSPTLETN